MTQELWYTSAPRGLKPGSRGFCTVVCTQGMAVNLAERLESLSGYRHLLPPQADRSDPNPVAWNHVCLSLGGQRLHVCSRIASFGLDYSGRSNKFAHHVVLEPEELPPAGPAWLLQQPGFLETAWDGQVRVLPAGRKVPQSDVEAGECRTWQQLAGDAGWAGVLAETALVPPAKASPVYLLVPQGADVLGLLAEAVALLPQDRRWDATFSTFYLPMPGDVDCRWRAVIAGTPEAAAARRHRGARCLDLTRRDRAPDTPAAQAAREGKCIVSPAVQTLVTSVATAPVGEGMQGQESPPPIVAPPPLPARDILADLPPAIPVPGRRHRRWWIAAAAAGITLAALLLLAALLWPAGREHIVAWANSVRQRVFSARQAPPPGGLNAPADSQAKPEPTGGQSADGSGAAPPAQKEAAAAASAKSGSESSVQMPPSDQNRVQPPTPPSSDNTGQRSTGQETATGDGNPKAEPAGGQGADGSGAAPPTPKEAAAAASAEPGSGTSPRRPPQKPEPGAPPPPPSKPAQQQPGVPPFQPPADKEETKWCRVLLPKRQSALLDTKLGLQLDSGQSITRLQLEPVWGVKSFTATKKRETEWEIFSPLASEVGRKPVATLRLTEPKVILTVAPNSNSDDSLVGHIAVLDVSKDNQSDRIALQFFRPFPIEPLHLQAGNWLPIGLPQELKNLKSNSPPCSAPLLDVALADITIESLPASLLCSFTPHAPNIGQPAEAELPPRETMYQLEVVGKPQGGGTTEPPKAKYHLRLRWSSSHENIEVVVERPGGANGQAANAAGQTQIELKSVAIQKGRIYLEVPDRNDTQRRYRVTLVEIGAGKAAHGTPQKPRSGEKQKRAGKAKGG